MERRKYRLLALVLVQVVVVVVVISMVYRIRNSYQYRDQSSAISGDHSACNEVGKSSFTDKESVSAFMSALQHYKAFHKAGIYQLKRMSANSDLDAYGHGTPVRTLTWSCKEPGIMCAGIGDQFRRIAVTFFLSVITHRVFTVYWSEEDLTMQYPRPNEIDWTFFDEEVGMHRDHDNKMDWIHPKKEEFTELSRLLHSSKQHITIAHEVPFSCSGCFEEPTLRRELDALGIPQLRSEDRYSAWVFITGTILRYLFKFPNEVITKLEKTQILLGIHNQKYLAIHIRTGFVGTDFEEKSFFDTDKAFKNTSSWRQSLECSLRLADERIGPTSPILLVSDSNEVKKWAQQTYGDRIRSTNTIAYHVKDIGDGKQVNTSTSTELTGTWVDFLLLARAHILVHSSSGYSVVASVFCSIPPHRQYGMPDCKQ